MYCMQAPMFSHRRLLFWVNGIIGFSMLLFLIGYTPTQQLIATVNRFTDGPEKTPPALPDLPCKPYDHVIFLKTHKCASSSVQNILMRYAYRRNLTLVLPLTSSTHYLSRSRPFTRKLIDGAPWEILGYDILCHHMVFNPVPVHQIMPQDSIYITIVRNPVSLFESMYEYDKLQDRYKMDIQEYARATKNRSSSNPVFSRAAGLGRNQMLYDLGVRPHVFEHTNFIMKAIDAIDNLFHFVMVAEYFDESIVMLRHILCWSLDDVVSLTVNARMDNFKKNLTKETTDLLLQWHHADYLLYQYFLDKFERTMDEFGRGRLAKEVEELRERRKAWFDSCVEKVVQSKNLSSYKIWSEKVVGFKLKNEARHNSTCEDLVKPENFFTNQIRQQQLLRAIAVMKNYEQFYTPDNRLKNIFKVYKMADKSKKDHLAKYRLLKKQNPK